jgi:hypothetical protein
MNERLEELKAVFALRSKEDPSLFVADERSEEVIEEADDSATGVPFTDSMDEDIVLLFTNSEDALAFIQDNDLVGQVEVVPMQIADEEAEEAEDEEEVEDDVVAERMRLRRSLRRLGERVRSTVRREGRRLTERRIPRNSNMRRPSRISERARIARRARR